MDKKFLSILLVFALIASLLPLVGCAAPAPAGTGEPAPAKMAEDAAKSGAPSGEKVTIRILTRFSDDTALSRAFQEKLAQFRQENPDIIIEDESVMDEDSFNNKFKTAIASSNLQDIFVNYGGANIGEYVKNGLFLDLTDTLKADPAWSDMFMPIFDNWQITGVDGIYGVPSEFYAVGLYYNKELFEKAGLEPPETMEELYAAAEKFMEQGIIPLALGDKDNYRAGHFMNNLVMKLFGYEKIKALANRTARYTDPDMVEMFRVMYDMNNKGYFGPNIVSVDYNTEKELFFTGKTAMHMDGSWFLGEIPGCPIEDKIGFVPFPYFAGKPENKDFWMGGAAGGMSLAANTTPERQAASIKLLKYLTSVDYFKHAQGVMMGGIYPVKMEADPAVVSPLTIDVIKAINTAKDMKTDVPTYDSLTQLLDRVRNSIAGMFAGGTPEQCAKEIQDEIDKGAK